MLRPSSCCMAVMVGLVLVAGAARAADPAWSVGTVDSTGSTGWASTLAFDPADGNPSIAFGELSKNQVKFSDWNGSRWVTEVVATGGGPDLGYDSAGRPCMSLVYGGQREVRLARRTAGRWTFEYVDKGVPDPSTSLAFDAAGNPAIAYVVTNRKVYDLKLARWNGVSWSTQVVDTDVTATYQSLAFNGLGNPAIAYSVDANKDGRRDTLKFAWWNGSTWIREVVDTATSGGGLGASASLAYDPVTGEPCVAYTSRDVPKGPRFARRSGAGWIVETIEGIDYGFDTSLAFGSTGRPYVFYVDAKSPLDDVKLAWRDAGAWTREVITSAVTVTGSSTCLALGPGGAPAASFKGASPYTLFYGARASAP